GLGRAVFLTLTLGGFYLYDRLSNRAAPAATQEGSERSSVTRQLPSLEGSGVGSGSQSPLTFRGISLQPRSRVIVESALILLLVLDLLPHVPRKTPFVAQKVLDRGLMRLPPHPRHGDGRAIISPANNLKLYRFATTNAFNDYINNRRLLFANCNLLDAIPKVNGFYSLYVREADAMRAFLYDSTNTPPEALCDFLGVTQITDPENFLEWKHRPGYLPLASAGQKPVFADGPTTFEAMTGPEFNPRSTVYLPLEARSLVSSSASPEPTGGEAVEEKTEPKIT